MKAPFLTLDTLDDRREVHRLLSRLAPDKRVDFIRWCCRQIPGPFGGQRIQAKTLKMVERARICSDADSRLTYDLYFDFWALCTQHNLPHQAALAELIRRVKESC